MMCVGVLIEACGFHQNPPQTINPDPKPESGSMSCVTHVVLMYVCELDVNVHQAS